MSTDPAYRAANTVAPIVEAHFARTLEEARKMGEDGLAPQPSAQAIAAIVNATFWPAFVPKKAASPKSRWPTYHPNKPDNRCCLNIRCH